jgi:hypothetical protein
MEQRVEPRAIRRLLQIPMLRLLPTPLTRQQIPTRRRQTVNLRTRHRRTGHRHPIPQLRPMEAIPTRHLRKTARNQIQAKNPSPMMAPSLRPMAAEAAAARMCQTDQVIDLVTDLSTGQSNGCVRTLSARIRFSFGYLNFANVIMYVRLQV